MHAENKTFKHLGATDLHGMHLAKSQQLEVGLHVRVSFGLGIACADSGNLTENIYHYRY